jgi:hypothetical protein
MEEDSHSWLRVPRQHLLPMMEKLWSYGGDRGTMQG